MQFIVENEAFARALGLVKGCVPTRSTIPILSHVAVIARGSEVVVRATNLAREVETAVPAEVVQEGGAALPGEVLAGLAKRLAKGGQTELRHLMGRAQLTSGSSKYDLRTLPIEDFPSIKEMASGAVVFGMDAATLRDLIQATVYPADPKGLKPYNQGIHLHAVGKHLVAVATDDHRLARRTADLPKGAASMPGVTIPEDSARAMLQMLEGADGVELAVSASLVELRLPGVRLASALLECTFPDYERVIPKLNGTAATFRPYALAEALGRATTVYLGDTSAGRMAPTATLTFKGGSINLEAGIRGNEQAVEVVDAETNGHDISFTVNAQYLADMLGAWPETVAVGVQQADPSKPILFTAADRPEMTHVIMPARR